jgi:GNAT superfamily N-acetyltransferase
MDPPQGFHGQGLGSALLKDALLRTLRVADIAGIRAVIVHAKNAAVRQWYQSFGFESGPINPMHLFLLLKDIQYAVR